MVHTAVFVGPMFHYDPPWIEDSASIERELLISILRGLSEERCEQPESSGVHQPGEFGVLFPARLVGQCYQDQLNRS